MEEQDRVELTSLSGTESLPSYGNEHLHLEEYNGQTIPGFEYFKLVYVNQTQPTRVTPTVQYVVARDEDTEIVRDHLQVAVDAWNAWEGANPAFVAQYAAVLQNIIDTIAFYEGQEGGV